MTPEEVPSSDLPETIVEKSSGNEVPSEDLPAAAHVSGQAVPSHDLPKENIPQNMSSMAQTIGSGIEGAARGVLGHSATYVENKLSDLGIPGLSETDQMARETAHPYVSKGSEVAGSIIPYIVAPAASVAIGGVQAASDELGKYLMGDQDSLGAAASHIAGSMFLNKIIGAAPGAAKAATNRILETKLGKNILGGLSGFGDAASKYGVKGASRLTEEELAHLESANPEIFNAKAYSRGQNLFNTLAKRTVPTVVGAGIGAVMGEYGEKALPEQLQEHARGLGALGGALGFNAPKALVDGISRLVSPYVDPAIKGISKNVIAPVVLKMARSGSLSGLEKALGYASEIEKGQGLIRRSIEGIFKGGANEILNESLDDGKREKIKKRLEDLDLAQQSNEPNNYASGGQVDSYDPIAHHWPEQAMHLSTAKARVTNYLSQNKPTNNLMKLTYDSDHPDKNKERRYHKLMDLANNPLSVINKVKDGSLTQKDMKDYVAMYPEVHGHLSKKITERLLKGKMEGEKKPSYKVRQALSLFLGSNLDSSLAQPNIMAAQNVFLQQNAAKQQQAAANKLSASKIGEQTMTPNQSREKRLNKD